MVVWPEISSPAQSFASVMKVPSNSCFPCRAAFCSFCFGSLGASSGSLWQQTNAHARHTSTTHSPARNVKIDDRRKHHHFRTLRHSTSSESDAVVVSSSDEAIPLGCEASSQACHAPAATRVSRKSARDWAEHRAPAEFAPREPGRCRTIDQRRAHYRPDTSNMLTIPVIFQPLLHHLHY